MYIAVTYDGKVQKSYASSCRKLEGPVGLDASCELVVEVPDGPISYYESSYYDTASRGKIKSVGNVQIKYFDDMCYDFCKGRVRSIGNIEVWYYDTEAGRSARGKVKYINDILVEYYGDEFPSYKAGKPKQVGHISVTIL